MKLRIQKLHPGAPVPVYSTDGAAAFDLFATTVNGSETAGDYVTPDHPVVVGTGLAFEVPPGYMLEIRSRSGLAFRCGVIAFPGTIDSDYRGEVKILLTQHKDAPPIKINPGDRIAQGVLIAVPRCEFEVTEQLTLTDRAAGGFGSTGK